MASSSSAAAELPPVNVELLTLTYGAMVAQLLKDFEDPAEVNTQLEKLGYQVGSRLVDDFCARNPGARCKSFQDSMQAVATVREPTAVSHLPVRTPPPLGAQQALPTYLGMSGTSLERWNEEGTQVSLLLPDNPLEHWVQLPESLSELQYCSVIGGAIRGALEMVNLRVSITTEADALKGESTTALRIQLDEVLKVQAGEQYQDE